MFGSLCISLVLTIIIETLLALIVKIKDKYNLSVILWGNCFTNPIVVYLTNISFNLNNDYITNTILIILEILVVFVEGYLFKKFMKDYDKNKYLLSLYLYVFSFLIGIVITYIWFV